MTLSLFPFLSPNCVQPCSLHRRSTHVTKVTIVSTIPASPPQAASTISDIPSQVVPMSQVPFRTQALYPTAV